MDTLGVFEGGVESGVLTLTARLEFVLIRLIRCFS